MPVVWEMNATNYCSDAFRWFARRGASLGLPVSFQPTDKYRGEEPRPISAMGTLGACPRPTDLSPWAEGPRPKAGVRARLTNFFGLPQRRMQA